MKILVNYTSSEKKYIVAIAHILKSMGLVGMATDEELTAKRLVEIAKSKKCDAILVANEKTLRNLVPNPKATLDDYRGSKLNLSMPAIVINKLQQIYTVGHGSYVLKKDINKLFRANEPSMPFTFTVLEDQSTYPKVLEIMATSILTAYDIETITLLEDEANNQAGQTLISCAGWSCLLPSGDIHNYVLPLIDFGVDHWVLDSEYFNAIKFLRDANALPTPKVMHGGAYDCLHSIVYHAEPRHYNLDTMALAHSEYSELPKTLDYVASLHLPDFMQWKNESDAASKNKDIQQYWAYNARDIFSTLRVCIEQLRTMPAYAKRNYAEQFKLTYPCLYCEFEGFKIDNPLMDKLRTEAQEQIEADETLLRTLVDDPSFNPGSWQQVEKVIYKIFGAVKPKIGKSKSCTDEKNLAVVGEQHPLLELLTTAILNYRGNVKARGTYYNFLQKAGRLLYRLNPFGTDTSRMSCTSSSFWAGTQVQNIPSYPKHMLVADEGFELSDADYKQAEGRCTAYLAQDEPLIKALEDPVYDFYKTLGFLFFQIPYENVTDFFRNKVLKRIVHGTNYMMGAKTFKENIGMKILHQAAGILGFKIVASPSARRKGEIGVLAFCKLLLEKYHVPFKRVRKWYEEIKQEVIRTGKLTSPLGHTRVFFGDMTKDHNMLRSAVAHAPQNLSVSLLNKGMWNIYINMVVQPKPPLKLGDYRLKAQIHDSIIDQYREGLRDIVIPMKIDLMTIPVNVHGRTMTIPVDAGYGQSWGSLEDYKRD